MSWLARVPVGSAARHDRDHLAAEPEPGTWVAALGGAGLAVTRLSLDEWTAVVVWRPDSPREVSSGFSPVCKTRLEAQAWAERTASTRKEPPAPSVGPFETEREARESPAAQRASAQTRIAVDARPEITRTAGADA
jgi:hypothetical protein